MTIEYNGRQYHTGRLYNIQVPAYHLRVNDEDKSTGLRTIKGKLVLKKYMDGEMYTTDYHYGFMFEYKRVWNGVERIEEITLPDAIRD